jgi:heme/copper-type cytochrome/quinol oxidase subunit 3
MENRLMMKLIVGTESMFFLSLIMAYVYFSVHSGFKNAQSGNLDLQSTALFTVLLFLSSFTFWRAEVNSKKKKTGRLKGWLLLTVLLGGLFLVGQGHEYSRLLHSHVTLSSSIFGTSFFTLTGFHGLHVFIGLLIISVVIGLSFKERFNSSHSGIISTIGIYWHFVDVVWLFVFSIVYVLPHLNILK